MLAVSRSRLFDASSPLGELVAYRDLLYNLVARDLKVRYRGSVLGFFWTLLNPLLMMAVFTLVFRVMTRREIDNFPQFALLGLLSWNFLAGSLVGAMHSITSNGSLINKVYFPREVLPLSVVIANLVNFLLTLPVYFALAIVLRSPPPGQNIIFLPAIILLQVMFVAGLARATCTAVWPACTLTAALDKLLHTSAPKPGTIARRHSALPLCGENRAPT